MTKLELVKEKLKKVSSKDLEVVDDFIEKILYWNKNSKKRKMKLNLGGALKELSKEYTSVELQHKANEWRVEDAMKFKKK